MSRAAPSTSLRRQVLQVVLATTCLALLFSATAMLIYELRSYQQSWINDLQTQADIIARASAPALSFDDPKAAAENLALLKVRPRIVAAAVYRAGGGVFASYLRAGEDPAALPARPGADGATREGQRLELVQTMRENGEAIGSVYLRAQYDIEDRLRDYLAILTGVMLTSLVVAALVTARVQRRITEPILGVAQVARDVMQRRDFALRAPRTSTLEVDVLVDAFNGMLQELGTRSEALEQTNRHLSAEMAQRQQAEQALTQAARTKDEFLATLAHELRNPLAPISNSLHLLRRAGDADARLRHDSIEIMARQLRQMVRLIDDLLDVSRITTGKLLVQREPVDLLQVLRNALEIAAPLIEARGHRLALDLPEAPLWLDGDATRLAQVFANLLNNAAKYTEPGGRLGLAAAREGGGVRVRVSDDGAGVDPAMQAAIFDMFVQADQPLERGRAGLGVGLTLARRLVELHGGRIAVSSAGLGAGSTFEVWLPLAAAALPAPAPAPAAPAAAPRRQRILLVDDNVDFAVSLRRILESLGHEVGMVHDGLAALSLAPALAPDVVVLDIGMPGLDGYELAQRLRAQPATRASLYVAVTGWGQEKDRRRAREAGFDHHLVKPVDVAQLRAVLELAAPAAPG